MSSPNIDKKDLNTIAGRVWHARDAAGMSRKNIHDLFGTPQKTIENYEKGVSDPSFDYLQQLVSKFGISAHWLMTGEGEIFLGQPTPQPQAQEKKEEPIAINIDEGDDLEILEAVIMGAEQYCIDSGVQVSAERKAREIVAIFAKAKRGYDKGMADLKSAGKLKDFPKKAIKEDAQDTFELIRKLK